jgi:HrpA-like RNA helicase
MQKCVDIISNMEKWEMKEQLKKPGAVLVFLPGIREIKQVQQQLESIVSHFVQPATLLCNDVVYSYSPGAGTLYVSKKTRVIKLYLYILFSLII